MSLVAVRHAETAWNRKKLFMGTLDVPLAPGALDRLPPAIKADVVVCSPLTRARATAAALFPGREIVCDVRLRERHMGEWEGRSKADVRARHPELFPGGHLDVRITPPSGESLAALLARVRSFLAELQPADGSGPSVVAVTHNGWIRAAQHVLGTAALDRFHAEPALHLLPQPLL